MKRLYYSAFSKCWLIFLALWILKYYFAPKTSEATPNSPTSLFDLPKSTQIDTKAYRSTESVLSKIEEIHDTYPSAIITKSWQDHEFGLLKDPRARNCSKGGSESVEDLLCMKPIKFLSNFTNPCWYTLQQKLVCLPYFQLLGVSKSGSTDLFSRICMHPDVVPNKGFAHKETEWWSWGRYGHHDVGREEIVREDEDFEYYLKYFAEAATTIEKMVDSKGNHIKVTGDGTPMDFWDLTLWPRIPQNFGLMEPVVLTPHLLRHVNPDVMLIVVFRDPVDRQYSDYWFINEEIQNKSADTFHLAVLKAVDVLHSCTRLHSFRWCLLDEYTKRDLRQTTRLNVGFYYVYLREWLKIFPREQFLFLQTEELSKNMAAQMRRVYNFLNLRELTETEMKKLVQKSRYFETVLKKDAEPMFQETRRILHKLYDPFTLELPVALKDTKFTWNVKAVP